ncbi:aminotransferase class V-fold PLP-dependent enzyme [Bacillus cihuensis]|uniref:aminotransferase class V-fold PLP-dependent enzyme n=1 Tax=Bacillus cihuensis TaxID=1208599 RepID=UPI0004210D5A|nr:aminotransferase class V-fold PLP-dependent enzyme [Bacillus cihuensis]
MEVVYKIASEQSEFEQIYKLNYQTFVEEIPQHNQNEQQRLIDRFDKQNTYIIAKKNQEVVGMIAVRSNRPFSLDQKLTNLDDYLPSDANPCEIRLLTVKNEFRKSPVFYKLVELLVSFCLKKKYNMALISGVEQQIPLYKRMGFKAFGEMVGTEQAKFQPMYLTVEQFENSTKVFKRLIARNSKVASKISFLPGPVQLHPEVIKAIALPAISHRSSGFMNQMDKIRNVLCNMTNAKYAEVVVGTGTLGNDIVAAQLSQIEGTGLILANGEFGYRLIDHASRFNLSFLTIEKEWNKPISISEIEHCLRENPNIKWVWTVHCETSTGYLYDLNKIEELCLKFGAELCVDACSSVGVVPVSFKNVLMATTVSGKALGSYPGLVIVFHRDKLRHNDNLPRYLDMGMYQEYDGTPFTHSSNLLNALHVALQKIDFSIIEPKAIFIRKFLKENGYNYLGNEMYSPGIITINLPTYQSSKTLGDFLKSKNILTSYESHYLLKRNWLQISLMGHHSEESIRLLLCELTFAKTDFASKV